MKKQQVIKEDAAGGAVGAGSIAVATSRLGDMRKKGSLKHFLLKFYSRLQNKANIKPVQMSTTIKEFYDLSDVVSRLKGVEGSQDNSKNNVVTFGVEDAEGNVMKVSVKKEQAQEFEYAMARMMADDKDGTISGSKTKLSLAELLYDLKDKFDIKDVEFPEIPKNAIYNADKATSAPDGQNVTPQDNDDMSDTDMDQEQDQGMEGDGMDDPNAQGGDMGDDGMDPNAQNGDMDSDMDGDGTPDDMEGGEGQGDDEDGMSDDSSVEDFEDEPEAANPSSLLQAVMDMLKADADAKKAQADAAAEEARAKQAEYSYKASQASVSHQEEVASMQADLDSQKDKQKQAKQLADIAKHRVKKANMTSMMGESLLTQVITELADTDTMASINRQKNELTKQWAVLPTDDPDTANYKKQRLGAALKEMDAKLQGIKIKTAYLAKNAQKTQQTAQSASNGGGAGAAAAQDQEGI